MQDQLETMKEHAIISSFFEDSKDGMKRLVEWFLNSVVEEEARIQVSEMFQFHALRAIHTTSVCKNRGMHRSKDIPLHSWISHDEDDHTHVQSFIRRY